MRTLFKAALFFCFTLATAHAGATVRLPRDIGIDTIVASFRSDFIAKILQITTNYSNPTLTADTAIFTATGTAAVICNGGKYRPVGSQVARIDKSSRIIPTVKGEQQMIEKISYYGCDGKVAFAEVVITDGTGLQPLDWRQIFRGEREFALQDNETRKIVSFVDDRDREFIGLTSVRQAHVINSNFTYYTKPVLTILETDGDDVSQLIFTLNKYSVSPIVDFTILPTSQFTSSKNLFTVQALKNGQTQYRESDQKLTSKDTFFLDLTNAFLSTTGVSMQGVFDSYITRFPPTVLVSTAAQNQRILLELQLAVTQLNSGLQINQVKLLLQTYIDSINNGQLDITDLRPKN